MDELREISPDNLVGERFVLFLDKEEDVDDYLNKGNQFPLQNFVKPLKDFIPKS
jgi:hypothetical protein